MGSGNWRLQPVLIEQADHQLLRLVRRREELSRQGDADADFRAAKQAYPASTDRGCQAGAPRVSRTRPDHARELERGNRSRATLAVARKMVCYMLAVERRQQDFVPARISAALSQRKNLPRKGKAKTSEFTNAQAASSCRLPTGRFYKPENCHYCISGPALGKTTWSASFRLWTPYSTTTRNCHPWHVNRRNRPFGNATGKRLRPLWAVLAPG